MLLQDKLESFLNGTQIENTQEISRIKAKTFGHKTKASTKFYSFEPGSRIGGKWHSDGGVLPHVGFIGAYSYINDMSYLRNEVFIGRYTSVGRRVSIGAGRHTISALSTSPRLFREAREYSSEEAESIRQYRNTDRKVVIGSDVWIGDGAVIMPGISIAHGAVIAANAVVTKDVAAYEIVGGVPAKTLGRRFSDDLAKRLLESKWWEYPHAFLKRQPTANVFYFLEAFESDKDAPVHYATYKIKKAKHALGALFRSPVHSQTYNQ